MHNGQIYLLQSLNYISNFGFNNNFRVNFKNLNTVGKNDTNYKSSPQVELMSIFEYNSSLPLIKETTSNINYLTPNYLAGGTYRIPPFVHS